MLFRDIIEKNARETPNADAYIFLKKGKEVSRISFLDLYKKASCLSKFWESFGNTNRRVILAFSPGIEFVIAYCACLISGTTAIPCLPPRSRREKEKFLWIVKESNPSLIIADDTWKDALNKIEELKYVHLSVYNETEFYDENQDCTPHNSIDANDIAMIQYTSGSTDKPKGVVVSQQNLVYNQECIKKAFGHSDSTTVVTWLPHYHDMGLIGNLLQPLYLGGLCVIMSPVDFIQKPILWLKAISKYNATTSGAPCFGYDYCVRKIDNEELADIDLSSWTVAYIGAEIISLDVLQNFTKKFSSIGFSEKSYLPCYGLAESTLLSTATHDVKSFRIQKRDFVSTGHPYGVTVKIVNPDSLKEVEDGSTGEVWIHGHSVARGYWKKPEISKETFEAQIPNDDRKYMRTGDLGFLHENELYISGRIKSMIIIRGKNYYSEDIEAHIQQEFNFLKYSGGAVFSIVDADFEKLVVVHEVLNTNHSKEELNEMEESVKASIVRQYGIQVFDVIFIREGLIPRTSSGKVIRKLCEEKYLSKEFSHYKMKPKTQEVQ